MPAKGPQPPEAPPPLEKREAVAFETPLERNWKEEPEVPGQEMPKKRTDLRSGKKLVGEVAKNHAWEERSELWKRAKQRQDEGWYGEADAYLLEWILAGRCAAFQKEEDYAAIWDALKDPQQRKWMEEHPIQGFLCRTRDRHEPDDPGMEALYGKAESTEILHSVMVVVTTAGRVLSHSRRGGQFTKYLSGGGESLKNLVHLHFASREGTYDELG
jgi:hypothetical protein